MFIDKIVLSFNLLQTGWFKTVPRPLDSDLLADSETNFGPSCEPMPRTKFSSVWCIPPRIAIRLSQDITTLAKRDGFGDFLRCADLTICRKFVEGGTGPTRLNSRWNFELILVIKNLISLVVPNESWNLFERRYDKMTWNGLRSNARS